MRARSALGLAAALVAASPAHAQDHAARVDRFLAALPPETPKPSDVPDAQEAETNARLVPANPGKEAEIRAATRARAVCSETASQKLARDALRGAAEKLTDAELDQLTGFYTGPDFARMTASGAKPSEAEVAELMKRYPLQRFMTVSREMTGEMMEQGFAAFAACDDALAAALERAGVKE